MKLLVQRLGEPFLQLRVCTMHIFPSSPYHCVGLDLLSRQRVTWPQREVHKMARHYVSIDVSLNSHFDVSLNNHLDRWVCHCSSWHGPQLGDLDGQLHFFTENIGDIGSDVKCRFVYVSPLGLVPRESSQTSCTLTSSSMVSQYGWSELYFTKHGGAFSIKHDLLMEALSSSTILSPSSLLSCLAVILLAFWSYFTRHLST